MNLKNIPAPEIYKSSADFRFFLDWFSTALEKTQYDTENLADIYDPLRCPEELLWLLADTMGYKFDDRLPTSFNRLVLLYFMSMIYNRGSRNGMILAGETNLAQFPILAEGEQDNIKYNRLENTSIPTNSVSVTSHVKEGYIDVVYFSTKLPKDACIEYVRPLGMFCFQRPGVEFSAKTKISIDAELTNSQNMGMDFGPTQVGHYRRADYATLQKMKVQGPYWDHSQSTPELVQMQVDDTVTRHEVWGRNPANEVTPAPLSEINPGYRALMSLQLSNNEEIVKALIDPVFTLGFGPDEVGVTYPDDYFINPSEVDKAKPYNLRYDEDTELANTHKNEDDEYDSYTIDGHVNQKYINDENPPPVPMPAINPIMEVQGEAVSLNQLNTMYMGEAVPTDERHYIYETTSTTSNTIFYTGTPTAISTPTTLDNLPVDIFRATTFNGTDVNVVIIPDGLTEIE